MSVNDAQFGDDRRSYVGPNSTLPRDLYYAFSNSLDRSKAFNVRQLVDAAAHKLDSLLCGEINAGQQRRPHRPSIWRRWSGVNITRMSRAAISSSCDISVMVGARWAPFSIVKSAC